MGQNQLHGNEKNRQQWLQTRALLRLYTSDQHRQLDQSRLLVLLAKQRINIAEYIQILWGMYQAYRFIEPHLLSYEQFLRTPPIVPYHPRIPSILAELQPMNWQGHKQRAVVLKPENDLDYWGMRYVLDGSCHGARYLLPRLEQNQGLCIYTTLDFWRLLADLTEQWPTVVRQINALAIQLNDKMRMAKAARRTFQAFIDVFQSPELNHEARINRQL